LAKWGPEKVILGADIKGENIAVGGWTETMTLHWRNFLAEWQEAGITEVMVTDISRDGMMAGPGWDLYTQIRQAFPTLRLIASGGVTTLADLEALKAMGMAGKIDLNELSALC
jgi:phosphoribosylformimino-5-aminoimidazole carboxamide ribotide isomerase